MRILIGTTIRRITVIIHRVKTMMIMGMQHYSPHDSRNYYYSLVKSSMLLSSFLNEGEGENNNNSHSHSYQRREKKGKIMNHHEALDDFDEGVPAVERMIRRVWVWESW